MKGKKALGDLLDAFAEVLLGDIGADDDELVAAVAVAAVVAERLPQHHACFPQQLVARLVPVGVVDALEVVEIHHHHMDEPPEAAVKIPPQRIAVFQLCQRIRHRRLPEREVVLEQIAVVFLQTVQHPVVTAFQPSDERDVERHADGDDHDLQQILRCEVDERVPDGKEIERIADHLRAAEDARDITVKRRTHRQPRDQDHVRIGYPKEIHRRRERDHHRQ